uniref:Sphingomyelin synthase-like domain-containing protein n=1 Tax=Panagrolaimus sp. JU765 TaxID=591449 RepID=A0AC34RKF4_9BILA
MKELLPITIKDISNPKKYEVNKAKTLWAFLFVGIGWFLNELSLAWIHDRVPRNVEPLPDLWFDWFPEIRSAIQITEYIMIFMTVNSLIIVICHQHRWIVARRVFFCAALAYIFRSLCITVIQMPVPSVNTYCAPQGNGSFTSIAARVRKIFWSAGIEQLRPRELCGDLIVSGHTITLFTAMMAFRQYCPRRLTIVGKYWEGWGQ